MINDDLTSDIFQKQGMQNFYFSDLMYRELITLNKGIWYFMQNCCEYFRARRDRTMRMKRKKQNKKSQQVKVL